MPTRSVPERSFFRVPFLFALLVLSSLLSCTSEEQRAFDAAREEHTLDAYRSFLSEFPAGTLASEADSLFRSLLPPVPFTSEREDGFRLYAIGVDGSGVHALPDAEANETGPVLSPEGERVAFVSAREGGADLFIMRLDEAEPTQVTHDLASVGDLAWSPDGTQIAFVSIEEGRNSEIFVVSVDGSDLRRITETPGAEMYPTWSPDGHRIAFAYHETKEPARAISTAAEDFFTTGGIFEIEAFRGDIWVMDLDGSGRTQLTDDPGNDTHPSWSPDGSKIAFTSHRDGNAEIYLMNPDGSELMRLTRDPASDRLPLWYPFWNKILFTSDREGGIDVWIMNPDGSEPTRLTVHEANDFLR